MISIEEAIKRGQTSRWGPNATHTENETAYLDRTLLATEVLRLQTELVATEQALAEAEIEVESLGNALNNINYEQEQPS